MAQKRDPLGNGRDLLLAVVLAIFGITTVVLGIAKIYSDIGEPFEISQTDANYEILTLAEKEARANAEKAQQDTDGDGLNDYEEEYVYGTSAYLEDSDSDGYSDKEEIDSGNDPLCPRGQVCNSFVASDNNDGTSETEVVELTTDQIRTLLLQTTDIGEETLAKFTDEELQALYDETIDEVGNPFQNTTTGSDALPEFEDILDSEGIALPGTDVVITSVNEIQELTPQQVRSFLESLGANPDDLDDFDNEVLKQVLIELIEENYGQAISEE